MFIITEGRAIIVSSSYFISDYTSSCSHIKRCFISNGTTTPKDKDEGSDGDREIQIDQQGERNSFGPSKSARLLHPSHLFDAHKLVQLSAQSSKSKFR
jgi:hypothetical protein